MKVTTITARYARKLNTGNYSNVDLEAWATVELEEGDEPEAALEYATGLCREAVREAAAPFIKTLATTVSVDSSANGQGV